MQYTELGKTKENVSILGFGAMRLPTKGSNDNIDENTASEILSYGTDNGINLIDTAYPITVPESTVTETAKFS